jgi:GNAT superfamily N-acetyltransferase
VDRAALLALFDSEMRRDPHADLGYRVEKQGSIVRLIGPSDHCIVYSHLAGSEARAAVAHQAAEFRARGEPVEWKVYAHDEPPELPALLAEAGFVPKPRETLMIFDLGGALRGPALPPDVEIRQVRTPAGLEDLEAVELAAFDRSEPTSRKLIADRLADPDLGVFVAYRSGVPVAGGRVDRVPGRSFAGIWGGGTVPEYRGQGLYRALVAARADFARARGARFLMVEALVDTSRPILERIGFVPLSDVIGWELLPPAQ